MKLKMIEIIRRNNFHYSMVWQRKLLAIDGTFALFKFLNDFTISKFQTFRMILFIYNISSIKSNGLFVFFFFFKSHSFILAMVINIVFCVSCFNYFFFIFLLRKNKMVTRTKMKCGKHLKSKESTRPKIPWEFLFSFFL